MQWIIAIVASVAGLWFGIAVARTGAPPCCECEFKPAPGPPPGPRLYKTGGYHG